MIDTSLRLATQDDMNFIYNSWLESYTENNRDMRRMGKRIYFDHYKIILKDIFEHAVVTVSCNREDPDQIYGYVVSDLEDSVCHYLYVKYTYRKLGIARKLLKHVHPGLGDEPLTCTFANKNFDLLRNKYNLNYNPFKR